MYLNKSQQPGGTLAYGRIYSVLTLNASIPVSHLCTILSLVWKILTWNHIIYPQMISFTSADSGFQLTSVVGTCRRPSVRMFVQQQSPATRPTCSKMPVHDPETENNTGISQSQTNEICLAKTMRRPWYTLGYNSAKQCFMIRNHTWNSQSNSNSKKNEYIRHFFCLPTIWQGNYHEIFGLTSTPPQPSWQDHWLPKETPPNLGWRVSRFPKAEISTIPKNVF